MITTPIIHRLKFSSMFYWLKHFNLSGFLGAILLYLGLF